MNDDIRIIRLAESDPAWEEGARFATVKPCWSKQAGALTGLAGWKTDTLEQAVRAVDRMFTAHPVEVVTDPGGYRWMTPDKARAELDAWRDDPRAYDNDWTWPYFDAKEGGK